MIVFDYIFYSVTRAFGRVESNMFITGQIVVSMFQIMFVFDFIGLFIYWNSEVNSLINYLKISDFTLILIMAAVIIFNIYRYNKVRYKKLYKKWGNQNDLKRSLLFTIISISLFGLIFLLPFLYSGE